MKEGVPEAVATEQRADLVTGLSVLSWLPWANIVETHGISPFLAAVTDVKPETANLEASIGI